MARAYLYRLPSTLRRRGADYLALTALVAVLGGLAMGSVTVGRLTQSSFAAFLRSDDASNLTMSTYGTTVNSGANPYRPSVEASIRRLPQVQSVEAWFGALALPISPGGAPLPAVNSGVNVAASVDGLYFHQDRAAVIEGRMPNPAAGNEFMTSATGARLLGIHLGQNVPFGVFDVQQTEEPDFGTAANPPLSRVDMRLVGIVEFNNQVLQDDTDRLPATLVLTPAFTRTLTQSYGTWYGIRLKPGVRDLGAVEKSLVALLPPGSAPNFSFSSTSLNRVDAAVRPESIALGGFGLITALAVLGIGIPILSRLTLNGEDDRKALRALGASPRLVAGDTWIAAVAALTAGTLLAIGLSAAVSALAPLGPVHPVYHPESPTLDWTVIGGGAAVFTGVLGFAAVAMARRDTRRTGTSHHITPEPASRLTVVAASAGFPAPVVLGTRFALEPGDGRTAVPARSVIGGAMLSVTLVVAILTFASGLRTLTSHPALYGWNWDYAVVSGTGVPPEAQAVLSRDPLVQGWSGYNDVNLQVDGREIPALGASSTAAVGPPLVSGRQMAAPDEVVMGQTTLASLGKRVGDTVEIGYGSPSTAPIYLPPRPLRIVGTATFPAIAGSSTYADHIGMGVGVLFTYRMLPPSFLRQIVNPDPTQAGPPLVFVRYRAGTEAKVARADVERVVAAADAAFAADPAAVGDTDTYEGVQRPAAIVNFQSTADTPLVLAATLAAGATVALALSLMASVRRRRRDLAVLKALGFTRAQTTATVAAQALVTAVLALAVGIPLGIAAGRQLWIAFARSIGGVPEPTVPDSVILVALVTLAVAVFVAVIPGRMAARTPAATVLRAE